MRYVAYLLIALTTALQGCSVLGPRPSDIPQRPIMEEQDTPFVFKQAYQTEGLYSTQIYMAPDNDFVDIAPSVQYVWWSPSASSDVYTPARRIDDIEESADEAVEEQGTVAATEPDSEINGDDEEELPVTQITGSRPEFDCATIICDPRDSGPCGVIQVCNGQVCEAGKRDEYTCLDDACSEVQAKTKGEVLCHKFPERYMCPQMTTCKATPPIGDNTVSIEAAQKLFMEGETDE